MRNQQLPSKLSEKQKTQIEKAIQDVRFDMWTGEEDKILRRVEVEFGFKLPKDLQQDAQGVQSGNIKLALEIADVNKEQEIKPPSNARPLSELQSTLGVGGALGGLGGSSGGASGGGSSGGGERRQRLLRRRLGLLRRRRNRPRLRRAASRTSTPSAPSATSTA